MCHWLTFHIFTPSSGSHFLTFFYFRLILETRGQLLPCVQKDNGQRATACSVSRLCLTAIKIHLKQTIRTAQFMMDVVSVHGRLQYTLYDLLQPNKKFQTN